MPFLERRFGLRREEATATKTAVVGLPSEVIVRQAKKIGAVEIIMGTRGLSRVSGFLLGSVAMKVVQQILRHSTILLTADTYSHVSPRPEKMERLEAYVRGDTDKTRTSGAEGRGTEG